MYTIEHLVAAFFAGLILGVVSSALATRKDSLSVETVVALVIMSVWMGMHVYSFFFGNEVDWVFNIAGFGAVGTFVGINLRSGQGVKDLMTFIKK